MKRFPQLTVCVAWLFGTLITFAAGIAASAGIAHLTNSGLGSCGPYGPAFTLLKWMVIGTFPISIIAGFVAAWRAHKYVMGKDQQI